LQKIRPCGDIDGWFGNWGQSFLILCDLCAVVSQAHGKHYYWDLRSGATQWEKPKATAKKAGNDADLKVQDAALPNGWEA